MENNERIRQSTPEELLLIEYLAQKAKYPLAPDWQQGVWAEPIIEERNGEEHVSCGNSKHCMRLILHGLLANLSAGRAGRLCSKK